MSLMAGFARMLPSVALRGNSFFNRATVALCLLAFASPAGSETVPGSMMVHWDEGARDCAATRSPAIQVHRYEQNTFILRESLCRNVEGNFIYLLIGSKNALLVDTGIAANPSELPLARTIDELLPSKGGSKLPLVIVHTHEHQDHRGGDQQFSRDPSTRIVSSDFESMKAYFGFTRWPSELARIDLGDRIVTVIPTPGHTNAHLAFFDDRTGLLLTGDFLLPGRLTVEDADAALDSANRLAAFVATHPISYALGGHIELSAAGDLYGNGSHYHPGEHPLELTQADVSALPSAISHFNGFYSRYANFIITNPLHNLLALGSAVSLVLLLIVLWARRQVTRWRRRSTKPRTK